MTVGQNHLYDREDAIQRELDAFEDEVIARATLLLIRNLAGQLLRHVSEGQQTGLTAGLAEALRSSGHALGPQHHAAAQLLRQLLDVQMLIARIR